MIHFAPAKRIGKYRNGKGGNWNVSSLDDGQTQAALQLLIRADQALGLQARRDPRGRRLRARRPAQGPVPQRGFPQVWTAPVEREARAVKAKYPDYDWKTEGRIKNYWDYYTLNDDLAGTVADTLIAAHQVYKDDKYRAALEKLGDFLILAQMPDPQPGWCQQYNYEMVPSGPSNTLKSGHKAPPPPPYCSTGSGGTLIADPPADSSTATINSSATLELAGPAHDSFIFFGDANADTLVGSSQNDTFIGGGGGDTMTGGGGGDTFVFKALADSQSGVGHFNNHRLGRRRQFRFVGQQVPEA